MKIYVDGGLPKSCAECKILGVFDWCNYLKDCVSDEIKNNKRHVLCPLETTQSLKQQVREEVVEEIRERLKKANFEIMSPIDLYSYTDNFLYQVEKGETK